MKLKCLIIDDEPMALDILRDYIEKVPFLELSAVFRDAIKALDYLRENNVDCIFLDINMPDLTGLQFLKSLVHQPMVIFTTAYSKYAVDSYDFNAVDYLLKPIEFERFLKAVNRAQEHFQLKHKDRKTGEISPAVPEYIMVKDGSDIHKVNIREILYIQSAGNYVTFVLPKTKLMSLLNMQQVLKMLPANQFFRIHKSYIISLQHISKIERHQVLIGTMEIPIGNIYRESFFKSIER
jgi:two-component system LytT family response regulator